MTGRRYQRQFVAAIAASLCLLALTPTRLRAQARGLAHEGRKSLQAALPHVPGVHAQFISNLPPGYVLPQDPIGSRLLAEYGAVLVARGDVVLPAHGVFSTETEVTEWQARVSTSEQPFTLQAAAARALAAARDAARRQGLNITPRADDAAARSYQDTLKLWRSRVEPGLDHWVEMRRLSREEADEIRRLTPREQAPAILQLEGAGMFFSKDFTNSILVSVAPPGASQHLALLAFDVKEHDDARVRAILARHGWHQTVVGDLPHFTYLGAPSSQLSSLGLVRIAQGGRHYWVPRPASSPTPFDLFARR